VGETAAHQRQRQFRDLCLQGGYLLVQQAQLVAQGFVRVRTGRRPALTDGRSASRQSNWFGSREGRGQAAIMQLGHLLELWERQTFEASIRGMQATRELSGFEPQTQGFGINA
jgi:hypothetical protein